LYFDIFIRSYRNGFVWNDLAENDVIYPSDCAEYVLKGSEITGKLLKIGNSYKLKFVILQNLSLKFYVLVC